MPPNPTVGEFVDPGTEGEAPTRITSDNVPQTPEPQAPAEQIEPKADETPRRQYTQEQKNAVIEAHYRGRKEGRIDADIRAELDVDVPTGTISSWLRKFTLAVQEKDESFRFPKAVESSAAGWGTSALYQQLVSGDGEPF
ncbi:MAG: hypothetical protein OXG44_12750 [Gammaproteobacteria bacterium]|nr:hypothetical protein [Gammaproteobacteria bacterium]